MSTINQNRAAYQHIPNIHIGSNHNSSDRASVGGIVVFCAASKRRLVRLSFTEHTIRNICSQNPSLNPLNVAVKLATGSRIIGQYQDSCCGISKREVIFRSVK